MAMRLSKLSQRWGRASLLAGEALEAVKYDSERLLREGGLRGVSLCRLREFSL